MKYILATIALLAAIVWGVWLIVIPQDMIRSQLENAFSRGAISVTVKGLEKGLFYSVGIEALEAYSGDNLLISAYDIRLLPDWASLMHLRAGVRFSGEMAGGTLTGSATTGGEKIDLEIQARQVQLAMTNISSLAGYRMEGTLKADMKLSGQRGSGTLSVQGLRAGGIVVQGFALPEDLFNNVRGAFTINGSSIDITSLALEGKGLFARLSGTVNASKADLQLALMPESPDLELLMSAALARYKQGSGRYVVPIRKKTFR